MLIRIARVEDAAALCAAEVETAKTPGKLVSRPHELKVESFAARIAEVRERGRYIVAEQDEKLVGHAVLEPMALERLAHVLRLTIVVHPGHERRGIGMRLMKDLMEWSAANPNAGKIELLVRASNEVAIALYKKLGFQVEGRLVNRLKLEDGSYLDDIAMAWFPRRP